MLTIYVCQIQSDDAVHYTRTAWSLCCVVAMLRGCYAGLGDAVHTEGLMEG